MSGVQMEKCSTPMGSIKYKMGTHDFTIGSIISRNVNIYADRIGWVDENDKITHRKFDKNVNRLANGLLKPTSYWTRE